MTIVEPGTVGGTRDADIRRALLRDLATAHAGDPETLIVGEMGLDQGRVRVDVAVINGMLHGYEIKSDRDTLVRLPVQAAAYGAVFDAVTIVASGRHLEQVESLVPRWWGVLMPLPSGDELELVAVRNPTQNPAIDAFAVAQLLWRGEALAVLEHRGLAAGLRRKPRRVLWRALADAVAPAELATDVRNAIRRRSDWRAVTSPT